MYVAFSRVGNADDVKILKRKKKGDSRTDVMKNIVYKSILV